MCEKPLVPANPQITLEVMLIQPKPVEHSGSPAQRRTLTESSHPQNRIRLVGSPGPLDPHRKSLPQRSSKEVIIEF